MSIRTLCPQYAHTTTVLLALIPQVLWRPARQWTVGIAEAKEVHLGAEHVHALGQPMSLRSKDLVKVRAWVSLWTPTFWYTSPYPRRCQAVPFQIQYSRE